MMSLYASSVQTGLRGAIPAEGPQEAWHATLRSCGVQELDQYPWDDAAAVLGAIGHSVGTAAGGTSGGLYHVMLAAASSALAR